MAKKLTKRGLEKHFKEMDKEALVKEIGKLYSKFKDVASYYQLEFGGEAERATILASYKKKVSAQFYTRSNNPKYPKASELKKIISEFKKVTVVSHDIVDLMLHRVELAVDFTVSFGDIDEAFYSSTENAYFEALQLLSKDVLHDYFQERCKAIVDDTAGIGWGFHDVLYDQYDRVFGH